jgi:DNA-binding transcriptional MerR regulator/effector-binding domain-containing protein
LKASKLTIGYLSDISKISKRTLRLYDEKGLLKPSERDENNNYRYYSEQQIVVALMIREMKRRGFTSSEIKNLIKIRDLNEFSKRLDEKVKSLEEKISMIQEQLNYIQTTKSMIQEALVAYSETAKTKSKKMVIDEMPEINILFTRQKSYLNANRLFWDRYNELQLLRETENVTVTGPFSAIFHDHCLHQFFFDEGDLEVYLPIKETNFKSSNTRRYGGFKRASMIHIGWYADALNNYVELVKQIEGHGYKITGPAHEEYIVEFSYAIPKEGYVTRIFFPIE